MSGRPSIRAVPLALVAIVCLAAAGLLSGCGGAARTTTSPDAAIRALEREARPIGVGARFHEPARGPVLGTCRAGLGPRQATHVELFAENRVVLIASGIGVRGPTRQQAGRIAAARCYGALVTVDPTGVVLTRPGSAMTLADLFGSWGQPLSPTRLAAFPAPPGTRVRVFVDGRRRPGDPRAVPLTEHAEIVLEVGPRVPPHSHYTFEPGM